MSVCPSVRWLVTLLLFGLLGATNAVYSALFFFLPNLDCNKIERDNDAKKNTHMHARTRARTRDYPQPRKCYGKSTAQRF